MAGRTRGKELARAVLRWPGVGPAVGRAVGRLGLASGRAAPVLDSVYRRLPASAGLPYGATTETQHAALLAYYGRLENYLAHAEYRPRISIVVPTYKPVYQYLHEMLGSIALQVYPNWQLCIVDDASGDPEVTRILAGFAAAHPGKVAYATRAENGHIAATSNDALALADGDYVALLDHDDRLYPHALAEVVLGLNAHRAANGRYPLVVYTDERMIDEDGAPIGEVWLKPDWMPLLHLTSNYTNHLTIYSRELLAELGGFRTGFDGSQDHDLMLRATEATDAAGLPVVHLPTIAYQWRSHPGSVAKDPGVKSYSVEPAMRAVAQACERRERPAKVWREPGIVANRIDFELPDPPPKVHVLVLDDASVRAGSGPSQAVRTPSPTNTSAEPNQPWISGYANLEISHATATSTEPPAVILQQVLNDTDADFLVAMSASARPVRADWVTAMAGLAQLPEVGAVGGLLLGEDRRVVSAGLIGMGSLGPVPAMAGMPPTEEVYLAWPASIHEVLALDSAAMMVDVRAAREVGGFHTDPAFAFFHFGTDLCLRLREAGYSSVFTPYAEFVMSAAAAPVAGEPALSAGAGTATTTGTRPHVDLAERSALVRTWARWLTADPYFNPGLARSPQFRVDPTLTLPEVPPALFNEWLRTGHVG